MFEKFQLTPSNLSQDDTGRALFVSSRLNKIILESLDFEEVAQKIADTIPKELAFATGVVAVIDADKGTIRRVAASRTKEAIEAIKALKVPFKNIEIPLTSMDNLMVRAVAERHAFITDSAYDVLGPVLSKTEALKIQKIMGTKTTFVFPIYASHGRAIGVFVASTSKNKEQISQYEKDMIQIFIDGVGLAIEHAVLYSKLNKTAKELKEANIKLKELDRLKDEFVFIAVHDLRTPVTAIDGYLSMIKEHNKLDKETLDYFQGMEQGSQRLKQLVNDLLEVARSQSGTIKVVLKKVDIFALINDSIKEMTPEANNKKVAVSTKLDGDNKIVMADEIKMKEVLENLLSNAVKYNKVGGKIEVKTIVTSGQLQVSIEDTGLGIPKEQQKKVFQKFFRVEQKETRDIPGTGLGLFVVRMLIEKMNGKISLVSKENIGTTIAFTLPLAVG